MPLRYQVKPGDCISSIAFDHGFFPDTVWNYPDNAELKKLRGDPNVLLPGDIVVVPDLRPKVVSEPTNEVYKFRRKGVPEKLRVQFKLNHRPRANEPYSLEVEGKIIQTGKTTDSEGRIECGIPPNARNIRVLFNDGKEAHQLNAGSLNPIEEMSGVQGRLKNLGYYEGPVDGKTSSALEESLRTFQKEKNLEGNGALNEATRAAIKQAYSG